MNTSAKQKFYVGIFPQTPLFGGEIATEHLAKLGKGDEEFDNFLDALDELNKQPTFEKMQSIYMDFSYRWFEPVGGKSGYTAAAHLEPRCVFQNPFDTDPANNVMYERTQDKKIKVICKTESDLLILDPYHAPPTFINTYFDADANEDKVVNGPAADTRFQPPALISRESASDLFAKKDEPAESPVHPGASMQGSPLAPRVA